MSIIPASLSTGRAAHWVRRWKLWQLPIPARWYICALSAVGVVALIACAVSTHWRASDIALFAAILITGGVSIEATRHTLGPTGTLVWDMMPVWYQTIAVVLPPFYAVLAPCLLIALKQWRVMRSPWHRRVLSAAAVGMPYGAMSLLFHAIPLTATGPASGGTSHALAWAAIATGCGLVGMVLNDGLVIPAADQDGLTGAMDWALSHPVQLEEMGRRARVRVTMRTWTQYRREFADIVREMT